MAALDLLALQGEFKRIGIMISFSGEFSQGIIEELSVAIEKHLNKENLAKGDVYNVISIFVEQAQNIRNYCAEKEPVTTQEDYELIASSGIVTIGKDEEGYFIYSGNLIELQDMGILLNHLDQLSTLDKENLKKLYKEQRRKDRQECKRGAGLGLIDIFRKASYPVVYSFSEYNQRLKFYSIKVTV